MWTEEPTQTFSFAFLYLSDFVEAVSLLKIGFSPTDKMDQTEHSK